MLELEISLEQLRGMIGLRVYHEGIECAVIEVLEDGPSLVLEDLERNTHIQDNQYGDPHRRVTCTYTVPVLTPDCEQIHPRFLELDLIEYLN